MKDMKEMIVVSVRLLPVDKHKPGRIGSKLFLTDSKLTDFNNEFRQWVDNLSYEYYDEKIPPCILKIDEDIIISAGWVEDAGWRPISDLPDQKIDCVVVFCDGDCKVIGADVAIWSGREWLFPMDRNEHDRVFAWRELPELPEFEEFNVSQ